MDFSGSFFEGGFGSDEDPPSPPGPVITDVEEKEAPQCPPGLRQYETMVVLRPDMSEDERLALTQKYEEVNKKRSVFFNCYRITLICTLTSKLILVNILVETYKLLKLILVNILVETYKLLEHCSLVRLLMLIRKTGFLYNFRVNIC